MSPSPLAKKINILIATGIFPPDIGGPATYVETLRNELPEFSFEMKIVTYSEINNFQFSIFNFQTNLDLYRISRSGNIFKRYWRYFWTMFKLSKWADVVYVQGAVSEGLPSYLACKLRGKRYILKIVGDYAWEQGSLRFGVTELLDEFQIHKYTYRVELLRIIEKMVARHAKKIIVPSFYLQRLVSNWGIAKEKIEVIYNTVEKVELKTTKEQAKSNLNLDGDIILTIGRLVPWKGIETLIDLLPELLTFNANFKLVIIGSGPDREKLVNRTNQLNLYKQVIFTGKIVASEVIKYLTAADLFILNSGYEGLPHVIIEAMQCGLPVLASRIGGIPELIEPDQTGILFTYNNRQEIKTAILDLWSNKEKKSKLAEEAEKNLYKFSRTAVLEKTTNILKSIYESP